MPQEPKPLTDLEDMTRRWLYHKNQGEKLEGLLQEVDSRNRRLDDKLDDCQRQLQKEILRAGNLSLWLWVLGTTQAFSTVAITYFLSR